MKTHSNVEIKKDFDKPLTYMNYLIQFKAEDEISSFIEII